MDDSHYPQPALIEVYRLPGSYVTAKYLFGAFACIGAAVAQPGQVEQQEQQ